MLLRCSKFVILFLFISVLHGLSVTWVGIIVSSDIISKTYLHFGTLFTVFAFHIQSEGCFISFFGVRVQSAFAGQKDSQLQYRSTYGPAGGHGCQQKL